MITQMIEDIRKEYERLQILTQYFTNHHLFLTEDKDLSLHHIQIRFRHKLHKIQQELLDDTTLQPAIPSEKLEKLKYELISENNELIKKYETSFLSTFIDKIQNFTNKGIEDKKEDISQDRSFELIHTYVGDADEYRSLRSIKSPISSSDIAFQRLPELEEQKDYKKLVELYENLEYDDLKSKYPHDIETRYASCVNKLGCFIKETTCLPTLEVINHHLSQSNASLPNT